MLSQQIPIEATTGEEVTPEVQTFRKIKESRWWNWLMPAMVLVIVLTVTYANNARVASSLENQDARLYTIMHRMSAKSNVPAIEIDAEQTVVWCNKIATDVFGVREGGSIQGMMSAAGWEKHSKAFGETMSEQRKRGVQAIHTLECTAESVRGPVNVRVETWATPKGAMSFITPLD